MDDVTWATEVYRRDWWVKLTIEVVWERIQKISVEFRKDSEGICGIQKDSEGVCGIQKDSEGVCGIQKDSEGVCGIQKDSEGICELQKDSEGICELPKDSEGMCGLQKVFRRHLWTAERINTSTALSPGKTEKKIMIFGSEKETQTRYTPATNYKQLSVANFLGFSRKLYQVQLRRIFFFTLRYFIH